MKSLRHARAAALIALGAAFAAVAQAQDAAESLVRIRSVAEAAVRKNLPASAEVSADSLDSRLRLAACAGKLQAEAGAMRSEEHTSELQSLMRSSYAVFCLKKEIPPFTVSLSRDRVRVAHTKKTCSTRHT